MRLADVLPSLRDREVDGLMQVRSSDIDTVAHVLDIDPSYLSVQVRIHIPFHERSDVERDEGTWVVRNILARLRVSLDRFGEVQRKHRILNRIDDIPLGSTIKESGGKIWITPTEGSPLSADVVTVPPALGLEIQERMHYIHSSRSDTTLHTGLQLTDADAPLCYAAFSPLDRTYLLSAMQSFGGLQVGDFAQVAVMTRAFGYNPLPKNAMSKLFDRSSRILASQGFKYIITALNPFLGFKGAIFSGASFIPFALSPMRYWYNKAGLYVNRRSVEQPVAQKYETPPIIWLARGLTSRAQRDLESYSGALSMISLGDYDGR